MISGPRTVYSKMYQPIKQIDDQPIKQIDALDEEHCTPNKIK